MRVGKGTYYDRHAWHSVAALAPRVVHVVAVVALLEEEEELVLHLCAP